MTNMTSTAWSMGNSTTTPAQNSKTTPRPVNSLRKEIVELVRGRQLQMLAEFAMKVLEGGNSTSGNMTSV
ncbi:unnamed protein product [Caenorhabditis nigoni]